MFVGREQQLRDLKRLMRKKTASLVTCRGRRRIGKSTLIRELGKSAAQLIELEGLPPRPGLTNDDQLRSFAQQLARQTDLPELTLESWPQAFQLLASAIQDRWTVVLLDEISWLGGYDPDFAGHLKQAWDAALKRHPKLILVLCGSVSAWIDANILNATGFVGRDSWDIVLDELPLYHCDLFWGPARTRVSAIEKLRVLSITGGIPKYLEEIDPAASAEANIHRLCFRREGILFRELDQLFHAVFGKRATGYKEILVALAGASRTVSELSDALGKTRSGHMSGYLRDLVLGGFVAEDVVFSPKTGRPTRTVKYRLCDNYARFYLRYVEPHKQRIEDGLMSALSLQQLPEWDTVLGLQFENLVLNNLRSLTRRMDLERTPLLAAAPWSQKPTARKRGCQVDLLLLTRHARYVVEIKSGQTVGRQVIDEVEEKVRCLPADRQRSTRTVLVYEGRLTDGLQDDDFFDHLIPFADLLSTPP